MFQEIPSICIPILSNNQLHPSQTDVIALRLWFADGNYKTINFSHPDVLPSEIPLKDIKLHPKSLVLNKKSVLYHQFNEGIDLDSYLQYYADEWIENEDFYPKAIQNFYQRFYHRRGLSHIIPMSKLLEYADGIIEYIKPYYKWDKMSDDCIAYCEDFVNAFYSIEKNPVPVNSETMEQNYMWFTATSRPSNSWNTFNFSALNKNDGTRNQIHSRFSGGKLLQFDYDAFHIKLLAKILDYKFQKHPYEQIKEDLNLTIPYDEIKTKVFQNIYGTITDQFLHHSFFMNVQAVVDSLYDDYVKDDFIKSYFYGKRFRSITDPSPNKVFNYFLQSLETEYNVKKILAVQKLLESKKSILAMYMYDAFIFDVHPDELTLATEIKGLFETDGMTVKCSIGETFGQMESYL